ncbi:nitroreductase [Streptomyces rimosus subsp. pseudoverticillatus]|uniref:nitroreductase family protein n=1 Tax=Streptomyces rimosus TaxID=1927 RepID=UPI0006B29038|nr:nitroreductase family protein [Streptomyces rimosus]KOT87449.1 nitroreductase [Streptomyces rimosus subsp. pseudoverticillatus]
MAFAHEYLDAVLHRGRDGMPPRNFQPNWADAPRQTKLYRGLDTIELPATVDGDASLRAAFTAEGGTGTAGFTMESLSGMLLESYGRLARRIEINANDDLDKVQSYRSAKFARGTASGGGLYPVSIYWVAGPSAPVSPGVYYYNSPQHGIQRLLSGDVSGQVAAALEAAGSDAVTTDQFLLLGLKFWQNAFKYNSFSYHATTMDIGTVIQTWRLWAGARNLEVRPAFWFDEIRLGELIGSDPDDEGIFAVVPLAWDGGSHGPASSPVRSSVRHTDEERSRTVLRFELLQAIHADTRTGADQRPVPEALAPATALPAGDGQRLPLGPADFGPAGVSEALHGRRSSFGEFSALRRLTRAELSTVLAAAETGAALPCDLSGADGQGLGLVKFHVFVNHVEDVEPGIYEYVPGTGELALVKAGSYGTFLQRNYFLNNYNLEQAGAVVVPVVRGNEVIDAVGPRGYRLVNALVGSVAQAVYTASSGIGVGCGAALGFDNISYMEELGLEDSHEQPLLILMVGHERGRFAGCRFENS